MGGETVDAEDIVSVDDQGNEDSVKELGSDGLDQETGLVVGEGEVFLVGCQDGNQN